MAERDIFAELYAQRDRAAQAEARYLEANRLLILERDYHAQTRAQLIAITAQHIAVEQILFDNTIRISIALDIAALPFGGKRESMNAVMHAAAIQIRKAFGL